MTLREWIARVEPANHEAMERAEKRWDAIAKPLKSLGRLEDTVTRMAGMSRDGKVRMNKKALVVMCADNGVVEEGVTQTGSEVTAIVANQLAGGQTPTTVMCGCAGVDVFPVDIGILSPICEEYDDDIIVPRRLLNRCVKRSTANMTKGPAMTREEAVRALVAGAETAGALASQGYDIIATGEMGIGNTTTSSAMAAVFLNQPVETVTGRGSGLSSSGMERKVNAIRKAIEINRPDPSDAVDVLAKVGGLDIAGMAGLFIGGAACHIPVMADGLISGVAALTAIRICPAVKDYVITSHTSKEPAGKMILEAVGVPAILDARMSLGEGSGAVAAIPVFEMGVKVFNQMGTFDDIDMEAYTPQN